MDIALPTIVPYAFPFFDFKYIKSIYSFQGNSDHLDNFKIKMLKLDKNKNSDKAYALINN
ncbi:hypothetical protein BC781_102257 [Sediminitomix flava]|uniref:Uncharacterized protein n=1 Tax=Sediminitomix flava TaxID=379075 RepID=A0A315ZBN2_SEDFL|nr:hypothetical protein BC781_102257 [Sediminitomix flava]